MDNSSSSAPKNRFRPINFYCIPIGELVRK
jgi:hypothetical protein